MNIDFNDTKTAFAYKSNFQLKRALRLFKMMNNRTLVYFGSRFANMALQLNLPVKAIIKNTIFEQFCGGENVADCKSRIDQLAMYNVGTILDYSVEGKGEEVDFDATVSEIKRTIDAATGNKHIPFSVFKVTGLGSYSILKAANNGFNQLSPAKKEEYDKLFSRVDEICKYAFEKNVSIFIDAEDSWFQGTIDEIAEAMMKKYNHQKVIVYTTIQFYRWDRMDYLKLLVKKAEKHHFKLGVKLVRGAYMEKERKRAEELNYNDPIHKTKSACDKDYDLALKFCMDHLDLLNICAGTHNENSSAYLIDLMNEKKLDNNDERIHFAQLLGMSDHISFNLSKNGFNVAKYVPYGPVDEVMPYLMRRAEENTSVAGQTSRELSLIKKEIRRRKLMY